VGFKDVDVLMMDCTLVHGQLAMSALYFRINISLRFGSLGIV
jgi:hypothetical protein